jgi:tetratricopeptide (TPR) repeat protein
MEIVNQEAQKFMQEGDKLIEKDKYEEALHCYEEAISIDQNDPALWNKKGITLRSLGRYDEAVECFNKSLKISPRDLDAS